MILHSRELGELLVGNPIIYIDAGARGGLEGPWADISDGRLHVVAFEPDRDAANELRERYGPRHDVVAKALWSGSGTVPVHLGSVRGTSSVHPPNFKLLKRFAVQHAEPRRTTSVVSVECTTLDEALAARGHGADFMKIDTQGAEYEILLGAATALQSTVFGVIVETWTTEVHKGQRLTGDILSLMHRHGFELFDLSVAAAWHRRNADDGSVTSKRQITGLDLLFLREPALVRERFAEPKVAAKAAAIAELYGYPDLATEILDICVASSGQDARLIGMLRTAVQNQPVQQSRVTLRSRLRALIRRRLPSRVATKLHY